MPRFRSGDLTVAQQYHSLRFSSALTGGSGFIRRGALHWQVEIAPSPLSRFYSLKIYYKPPASPTVVVTAPDLVDLAGGRKLPHVYSQQPPTLCLYLPGSGEWRPTMLVERTILPWSILWLFYFEEWIDSDDWKGGGVHPKLKNAANTLN